MSSATSLLFQENLQKLMELQRDLVGLDSLVHPDRVSGSLILKWHSALVYRQILHYILVQ